MTRPQNLVLVVDDDERSRGVTAALLLAEGHRTMEADRGETALEPVRSARPDLVLLDVEMGGISGFEVVRVLKDDPRTRTIPIIMVTGLADRDSRLRALEAGAEDFLSKPVDAAELRARVRNHLRLKEYQDLLESFTRVLERRVEERTAELHDAYREAVHLLTSAAEYRDEDTGCT